DDARAAESFGDPVSQSGQRSDALMVVRVDPRAETVVVVSFPRDLLVEIAGTGSRAKINAAYNGGAQRVVDTIQSNFGIEVHHVLEVGFPGFREIVDALGGVRLHFD